MSPILNPTPYLTNIKERRIIKQPTGLQNKRTQKEKGKNKMKTNLNKTNEQILNELRETYPDILKENQWIPYTPTQLDNNAYFFTVEEINPYEETFKARQIILDQIKQTNNPATIQQLWNEFHQIKTTSTWKFNQIPFNQLNNHPVKNAQIINTTTGTTVSKAVELYREAIIKNGITVKNKTIMTIAWSKILITIYLYNQRHINFITSNGSYNHKQIQATNNHIQTSIQYYLNKPIRSLTDKARDFIELYATRVNYTIPEPNVYNYKEPTRIPANCFMEYTIEEKADDYFVYHKTKFTDTERKASPIQYIQGKRRVTIKTEIEEIYDLESILWLEQHKDQLADLDGEYRLRKMYDTFRTLEEYLAKFENAERMIDLRPAPTTIEELRQYQYEDEVMALHNPEYFWDNTTDMDQPLED